SKELAMFSTDKNRLNTIRQEVEKLMGVKKQNFLFKNNGDLTFADKASEWGLDQPSYSNGAAYADLDNDGDLDLVTNNINDEAFIYQNNLINKESKTENNFLRIKLSGEKGNMQGFGTKLWVYQKGNIYYAEHQTQRGYKSTVEDFEHFGLGKSKSDKVDSIKVVWLSGKSQVLKNVRVNQAIILNEKDGLMRKEMPNSNLVQPIFKQTDNLIKPFKHKEKDFVDFLEGQLLLPHKHSQGGPGIAVGDVNSDRLEDFIVGGAAFNSAKVFIQEKNGSFKVDSLPAKDSEDMGLILFDADNDSDLDLYCVSGSSEFKNDKEKYQDRFYRNSGRGKLEHDTTALPKISSSGGCVVANDFDQDGDLDLFVGGRIVPIRYPEIPESYLLINDGTGKFENQTSKYSTTLGKAGMVTSALWTDINNDGWMDLALVGEWMPITFFINNAGESFTSTKIPDSSGWWNSISGGDFDNDGDVDYVAGNLGLNSVYRASVNEPVTVSAKDFDDNGSVDAILCRYIQGKEYPVHPRETLTGQIPKLRGVAQRYSQYGEMGIKDLMPEAMLKDAMVLKSTLFASVYIENSGDNNFKIKELPAEAQFSPMYGISITDVNEDGNLDILTIGNSYASETLSGYYDAGIGNYLQGDGIGNFKSIPVTQSGFFVDGDAKGLANLTLSDGNQLFLATQNRDSLKIFTKSSPSPDTKKKLFRADRLANSCTIELKNGKRRKHEFYYGSGYLSSSSRVLVQDRSIVSIKWHKR
ncbi:MAG TPA: FG-GAP-like repeat-containing protein, partial [Chryseolinea sp.]|nr:FG-GAP-like repeat-containing protein [Chryseolinea sp.]